MLEVQDQGVSRLVSPEASLLNLQLAHFVLTRSLCAGGHPCSLCVLTSTYFLQICLRQGLIM
jgi:hypothetical protein